LNRIFAHEGLNEDTVRFIFDKKASPKWILAWRLKGVRQCKKDESPRTGQGSTFRDNIDYQGRLYYAEAQAEGKAGFARTRLIQNILRHL